MVLRLLFSFSMVAACLTSNSQIAPMREIQEDSIFTLVGKIERSYPYGDNSGTIILYEIQNGPYLPVDTVDIAGNGVFTFSGVLPGKYIALVNHLQYDWSTSVYYSSASKYLEAQWIEPSPDMDTLRIVIQPTFNCPCTPPIAEHLIEGVVSCDIDLYQETSTTGGVPSVQVSLERRFRSGRGDDQYARYSSVYTDSLGRFSFNRMGVEDGSYRVHVEYPGVPSDSTVIIDVDGQKVKTVIQATITEDLITIKHETLPIIPLSVFNEPLGTNFELYPNPIESILTINYYLETNLDNISFQVYDTSGRVAFAGDLASYSGHHFQTLDFSKQPRGIYFVKLFSDLNDVSQTFRIVKM